MTIIRPQVRTSLPPPLPLRFGMPRGAVVQVQRAGLPRKK